MFRYYHRWQCSPPCECFAVSLWEQEGQGWLLILALSSSARLTQTPAGEALRRGSAADWWAGWNGITCTHKDKHMHTRFYVLLYKDTNTHANTSCYLWTPISEYMHTHTLYSTQTINIPCQAIRVNSVNYRWISHQTLPILNHHWTWNGLLYFLNEVSVSVQFIDYLVMIPFISVIISLWSHSASWLPFLLSAIGRCWCTALSHIIISVYVCQYCYGLLG